LPVCAGSSRVKQGQAGNDPPYTVAYGQAPKFGGLLDLDISSLDVTAPQTERFHYSTVILRLWQSQDPCPCPAPPCGTPQCARRVLLQHFTCNTIRTDCLLEVVLYVTKFFCLHTVFTGVESQVI
jgi:hypothetical protein